MPKDVHPPNHSAKDVNSLKKVKNIFIFLKGFPSFGELARRCAHLLGHLSTSFNVFPKGFGRRAMSTIGYPHCHDLVRWFSLSGTGVCEIIAHFDNMRTMPPRSPWPLLQCWCKIPEWTALWNKRTFDDALRWTTPHQHCIGGKGGVMWSRALC